MKHLFFVPATLLVALAGCSSTQGTATSTTQPLAAQPAAPPVKLTASQELAKYCRVCVVDKGEKMEEFLPARLTTKASGHDYKFCSEPCRKKFDANHQRYLLASAKAK